jgi:hypothetical protein
MQQTIRRSALFAITVTGKGSATVKSVRVLFMYAPALSSISSLLSHGQKSFNLRTMSSDEDCKLSLLSNWPEFPDVSASDVMAKILAVRAPERAPK